MSNSNDRKYDKPQELRREWDYLVQQLHSLNLQQQRQNKTSKHTKDDAFELGHLLSQLNNLLQTFLPNSNSFSKDEAGSVVITLCDLLKSKTHDDSLMAKFCQVIVLLFRKHQVGLSNSSVEELLNIVNHMKCNSNSSKLEQLRALSQILFENGSRLNPKQSLSRTISFLLPLSAHNYFDREMQRLAITCLGNLCSKSGNNLKDYYKSIYSSLKTNIEVFSSLISSDISVAKLLSNTLRSFQCVVSEAKNLHEDDIKPLLGILKNLSFIGTTIHPIQILPSQQVSNSKRSRTPKLDEDFFNENIGFSSGSEHSDSEAQDRFQTWKIRFHSIHCIGTIARCNPKLFYGYWNLFIPTSPSPLTPSLITTLLHDPSSKVRVIANSTLINIIENSRNFLMAADDTNKHRSFTSFSNALGAMIRELHNGLFAAIDAETVPTNISQFLKCLTTLIPNVPYEKLTSGLLSGILSRMQKILNTYSESSVRSQALQCMWVSMATKSPVVEVSIMLEPNNNSQCIMNQLIFLCINNKSLKAEVLQVWAAIATQYHRVLSSYWTEIFPLIREGICDEDSAVRLQSYTVLANFTESSATNQSEDQFLLLWIELLTSSLFAGFKDSYHSVRAKVTETIANLTNYVVHALPEDLVETTFKYLVAMATDSAPSVRCAAVHTLGVLSVFPSVTSNMKHTTIIADVLIFAFGDPNLSVRTQVAWSIANFCDGLDKISDTFKLSAKLLIQIAKVSLKGMSDNDKVRSNAVRALGNLAHFAQEEVLQHENGNLLQSLIDALIHALKKGTVKVQWNACYAIGNFLKNSYVQTIIPSSPWLITIINGLVDVIRDCKNFKVRINAALALSSLPTRQLYQNTLPTVFIVLIESLETIDAKTDFAEFKYKENLQDQLSYTLAHICSIVSKEELALYISHDNKQFLAGTLMRQMELTDDTLYADKLKLVIVTINQL